MKRVVITIIFILAGLGARAQVNTKDLVQINSLWYKKGDSKPYRGDFVETNKKGAIIGTGTFLDGVLEGLRIKYFDNGNKSFERYYKDGVMNGVAMEYYENGNLKQMATVLDGRNQGTATMYYDTGEVCVVMNFEYGVQEGDYFEYSKDGKLLKQYWFIGGKADYSPDFIRLGNEAVELSRKFENEAAILKYDEAIRLNPTVAQAYFNRGACKSNIFNYEGAISDYDKAIELDPDYMQVYANRASARKNLFTSKGILELPKEQVKEINKDLDKALKLGAEKNLIEDIRFACKKFRMKKK